MVRRVLIGAVLASLLATPGKADAAYLRVADARSALAEYIGDPFPGGSVIIRRCDRHSSTVVICRYTVDQPTPTPEGAIFIYHGIAYIRIRRGQTVVRDPMLKPAVPSAEAPVLRWLS